MSVSVHAFDYLSSTRRRKRRFIKCTVSTYPKAGVGVVLKRQVLVLHVSVFFNLFGKLLKQILSVFLSVCCFSAGALHLMFSVFVWYVKLCIGSPDRGRHMKLVLYNAFLISIRVPGIHTWYKCAILPFH